MDILTQKYGLNTKKFEILDNGVKIIDKWLWKYFECVVAFEDISNKEIVTADKRGGLLVGSVVLLIVTIILFIIQLYYPTEDWSVILFWLGLSMICLVGFFLNKKDFRIIQGLNNSNIIFFNNNPDKKILGDFIKEIFEKRKNFFLKKYVNNSFEHDEKLRALNLLYERDVINLEEFNKQKKFISSREIGGF